ncbi:MAG: DUF2723 domain-containing protein [Clostridium sp.]|nr:DUF2723 domain-containing protein [Clostridium sp.]
MVKKYDLINNCMGWLCFAIAAVTYLLTIEPTASFWDCPEFILQGAKLEPGHPPGNPIFMLTARFFITVTGAEINEAAIVVNSMSALLSAATILLLFWTITHLVRRIMVPDGAKEISWRRMTLIMGAGLCGALAYTWSDTFWFSAVEGEVYAFSSFCTALVFWLILKWENHVDEPYSDRYLVLIAYIIGVSIAVHLLNLLCIPAVALVFYYRKWKNTNAKGSLIALGVSFVIVAAILYGLVPGFIKVAQWFELLFVNSFGAGYNTGALFYAFLFAAVTLAAVAALYRGSKMAKPLIVLAVMLSGLTFATSSKLVWLVLTASLIFAVYYFKRDMRRILTVSILSLFVIFVGYSSYALLLIRASAYTPMNQNAPDNVFALSSYLNREQYGQRPLFMGPVFTETYKLVQDGDGNYYVAVDEQGMPIMQALTMSDAIARDSQGMPIDNGKPGYTKVVKTDSTQADEYVEKLWSPDYAYTEGLSMPFTRIYSMQPEHLEGYKSWSLYSNPDLENIRNLVPAAKRREWAQQGGAPLVEINPYLNHMKTVYPMPGYEGLQVWKPTFADNLRFFLNYQLNHMFWRYFMWNFAGRQNDIQGNGEPYLGNWISGIPFIDNARLGDQSLVPAEFTTDNKGHNVFYMLPLLMGLFGIIWQSVVNHRTNPKRGIEQFWVIFFLFFMTGIAIVLYLNQTPGQPRERDYAFAGAFYAFAIWLGMGVPAISRFVIWACGLSKKEDEAPSKGVKYAAAAVAAVFAVGVPLQMVSQTWDDHDRSHRYTTRDFGANYLNSLAPNAIIFTNGDNDTFPLWYAQEVEGIRTDVRVINLSYLGTDWYANQQKHPFYEAGAVEFLARPEDYAYEQLSYSTLASEPDCNPTEAIEGLKAFYATPTLDADGKKVFRMATPNMYSAVDREKAIKQFGLNPASSDSIYAIPYMGDIEMPGLGRSFMLNTLLSFDIVANSVAGGFERPVYFATTVPGTYYLGLDPYMYDTGLASQVTPFKYAEASPMATTAYENILSKFKWGGLDDPKHNKGLYLDETVRRMVTTHRNTMLTVATELAAMGDAEPTAFALQWAKENGKPAPADRLDMARQLIEVMEEKLPAEVMAYESNQDAQLADLYIKLYVASGNKADLDKAEEVTDAALARYAALERYIDSLGGMGSMGMTEQFVEQYFPNVVAMRNFIDLARAVEKKGAGAEVDLVELSRAYDLADNYANRAMAFVYEQDFSDEELDQVEEMYPQYARIADYARRIKAAHKALGIDPLENSNRHLAPYAYAIMPR